MPATATPPAGETGGEAAAAPDWNEDDEKTSAPVSIDTLLAAFLEERTELQGKTRNDITNSASLLQALIRDRPVADYRRKDIATLKKELLRVPKDYKLVLYSMRHTFRDAMRRVAIDERTRDLFFGHEGSGVRELYGPRQPQAWQSALIENVTYPGLDLGRISARG